MEWDNTLTHWLNSFSGQFAAIDSLMIVITKIGPLLMVVWIALRWFAKQNRIHERHVAIQCGLATALGLGINQLILIFVHRVRPYDIGLTHLIIEKSQDFSFPSDHATVVFAIVSLLFVQRQKWAKSALAFAMLVCISRVYVGTHYVTDVIGGAVTGLAGVLVLHFLYRYLNPVTSRLIKVL